MPQRRKPRKYLKPRQNGGSLYTKAVNKLTGSKLEDGENHPIMYVDGKFKPGQFLGPGSKVFDKTKAGVDGVSPVDSVAKRHDLAYSLSKSPEDVRKADEHMIKVLNRIQKEGSDNLYNIYLGKVGITAKTKLEDWGVVSPTTFTSWGGIPEGDEEMVKNEYDRLTQAGYGLKKATKKKSSWMAHVAKTRKSNPDKSYKECLKIASKSYKK